MSINPQPTPAQSGALHDVERRSLRLLIVDDDATQRALISLAARHAGHAATLAPSCAEAIRQIQAARFDCVTLDLLPGSRSTARRSSTGPDENAGHSRLRTMAAALLVR